MISPFNVHNKPSPVLLDFSLQITAVLADAVVIAQIMERNHCKTSFGDDFMITKTTDSCKSHISSPVGPQQD